LACAAVLVLCLAPAAGASPELRPTPRPGSDVSIFAPLATAAMPGPAPDAPVADMQAVPEAPAPNAAPAPLTVDAVRRAADAALARASAAAAGNGPAPPLAEVAVRLRPAPRPALAGAVEERPGAAGFPPRPAARPAALGQGERPAAMPRPLPRKEDVPRAAWDSRPEGALLTRAALSALAGHGAPLTRSQPADIAAWCPAYPTAGEAQRAAFWAGFLSTLAKHESRWRADAVGGGGQWFGLLQIGPATARGYGCRATSGTHLVHGPANLSCAVRILAATVPRDAAIAAGGRGAAADWGPMTVPEKRSEMQAWLRRQEYCTAPQARRPAPRPASLGALSSRAG